jgi:hypothetical protein
VAEGARLESVFRGNSNLGSNPSLSAMIFAINNLDRRAVSLVIDIFARPAWAASLALTPSCPPEMLTKQTLEGHLPSQLYLAGAVRRVTDYPEIGVVNRGVRRAEDRMIERILSFETKLKNHPFTQFRK